MLVAFACGEQQVSGSLGVDGFVSADLSVLHNGAVEILSDPEELTASVANLRHKSVTGQTITL